MSSSPETYNYGVLHLGARLLLLSVASWMAVPLLVSWWRRCTRFRRLELSIAGPTSLPLIGNILSTLVINRKNTLDIILKLWGGHYGELSRMSVFNNLLVFVTDAKHIKQVLSDNRLLNKPDFVYQNIADILGHGLITANGELWKAHRTVIVPTFNTKVLEGYLDIFSAEAKNFVERMRPALGRDSDTEFTEDLAVTVASAVAQTTGCLSEDENEKAILEIIAGSCMPRILDIICTRSFQPWLWPSIIFNRTQLGQDMARIKRFVYGYLHDSIQRWIGESREKAVKEKLEGKRQERKSFFDLMLEAQLEQRNDFTHSQIVEEVVTVFAAATKTSVTSLTFTLKLLSIFPDVQQQVYEEVREVLGDGDRQIAREDLARLEYTERVLKESMRIFPALPFIARHVPGDIDLDGKTIPGGSVLLVNIYGAHRDPRYYPNPLHFDPDRFLPERVAERPPGSYLPFSAGPRSCFGKTYAMMQMKTILATTLRAYKLLPADDGYTHPSQFPLTFNVSLSMVGGAKVRFQTRE